MILKDPITGEMVHAFGPKMRKAGWLALLVIAALLFAEPFLLLWWLG